jgi:hypothetical protein
VQFGIYMKVSEVACSSETLISTRLHGVTFQNVIYFLLSGFVINRLHEILLGLRRNLKEMDGTCSAYGCTEKFI